MKKTLNFECILILLSEELLVSFFRPSGETSIGFLWLLMVSNAMKT